VEFSTDRRGSKDIREQLLRGEKTSFANRSACRTARTPFQLTPAARATLVSFRVFRRESATGESICKYKLDTRRATDLGSMTFYRLLTSEDGLAWLGVAFTSVYFVLASCAVRMVKRKSVVVVRYAPPDGI
jgi:hypothetical protein